MPLIGNDVVASVVFRKILLVKILFKTAASVLKHENIYVTPDAAKADAEAKAKAASAEAPADEKTEAVTETAAETATEAKTEAAVGAESENNEQ